MTWRLCDPQAKRWRVAERENGSWTTIANHHRSQHENAGELGEALEAYCLTDNAVRVQAIGDNNQVLATTTLKDAIETPMPIDLAGSAVVAQALSHNRVLLTETLKAFKFTMQTLERNNASLMEDNTRLRGTLLGTVDLAFELSTLQAEQQAKQAAIVGGQQILSTILDVVKAKLGLPPPPPDALRTLIMSLTEEELGAVKRILPKGQLDPILEYAAGGPGDPQQLLRNLIQVLTEEQLSALQDSLPEEKLKPLLTLVIQADKGT